MTVITVPLIAALTTGVLLLMQIALMFGAVLARRRNRQSLGDGGNENVLRAVRRHGNFAENAAIFAVGFALFEMTGGNRTALVILCAAFVLGRVSHIIGLSLNTTVNRFRFAGVALTAIVGIAVALRLCSIAVRALFG